MARNYQEVTNVETTTTSDGIRHAALFSFKARTGEINIAMQYDLLGRFVGHALVAAQHHAKSLERKHIPGGAAVATEIIPETLSASFDDVSGQRVARLVVGIGDLALAFTIDPKLARETFEKFSGGTAATPADSNRLILHLPISPNVRELQLPTHQQAIAPNEISMLPVKWAPYAGYITVLWGDFETRVDELILHFAAIAGSELPNKWNLLTFKKRRPLFLAQMRLAFAAHPKLIAYCEKFMEDAANLHTARNILVHGRLHGGTEDGKYVLVAEMDRKGETIRTKFQEPELVTMYHEIANLCGRIGFLREPDESPRKPQPFSSVEKQFLRGLRLDSRPPPPAPPKPQSPPRSTGV